MKRFCVSLLLCLLATSFAAAEQEWTHNWGAPTATGSQVIVGLRVDWNSTHTHNGVGVPATLRAVTMEAMQKHVIENPDGTQMHHYKWTTFSTSWLIAPQAGAVTTTVMNNAADIAWTDRYTNPSHMHFGKRYLKVRKIYWKPNPITGIFEKHAASPTFEIREKTVGGTKYDILQGPTHPFGG